MTQNNDEVFNLEQILHDPENQPSQYGTVPLEWYENLKMGNTAQNNELDLILDDAVVVGADVIGSGEMLDELYQGGQTLSRHFLFSEDELLGFLKLRETRVKSPISQNEQPKQIPKGFRVVPPYPTKEMWEKMAETSMYVAFDRFESDYQAMLNAAPTASETNTEVGE